MPNRQNNEIHRAPRSLIVATWIGIVFNTVLALVKAVVGFMAHSQALIADAAHSASDIIGSIVALFGIKISAAPPDDEHPYGHGKAEHIASFVVAVMLIFIAFQIAWGSIQSMGRGVATVPGSAALYVIVASIVVKEGLYQYKSHLGQRRKSPAIMAEAWHHRSDAMSSIAALIGVGLALIGDAKGWPLLLYSDALAGVVVSVMILRVGINLARGASMVMMEKVLGEEETAPFVATASAVPKVLRVDELLARCHGRYVIVDIKVGVEADMTVEQGHHIGKRVKKALMNEHRQILDVLVHINPFNPYTKNNPPSPPAQSGIKPL